MTETKFDPTSKLLDMHGKDYLPVNWRVFWFRQEHPKGSIKTEIVLSDPIIIRATVTDGDGNVLSTGHGSPKMAGVAKGRPFEGAETAAIGRALAHAGYGTQFTDEDEGEHLADAPIENDIITANAWDAWTELVKRADAVKVGYEKVDRAKTTKSQLRKIYKELIDNVSNAEEQAKAGK